MQSVSGDMDAPIPSVRWKESEEFMGGVREVICSSGGFVNEADVV